MEKQSKQLKPMSEIPESVMNGLTQKWMQSFEAACRAQNRPGIMNLISKGALICGAQKDGPMDHVLSQNFSFNHGDSRMLIHSPHALVCCSWKAESVVVGGPTYQGDATFYLSIQAKETEPGKQVFVAMHAHFSQH